MPPSHYLGKAQVDFGYALAKVSGVLKRVGFFVMVLAGNLDELNIWLVEMCRDNVK